MSGHSTPETAESSAAPSNRGGWEGSEVTQDDLDWLLKTRRITAEAICRLPGKELEPAPESGERVVFIAHFQRGFGLPVSPFFREFLDKFGLQPHHLPANAITSLSAYTSFMEGYLGLWPTVEAWARYFRLRKQTIPDKDEVVKQMTACGAASITPRKHSIFPRITGLESCRKWQRSFFYVKSKDGEDALNLPEFSLAPPTAESNWNYDPQDGIPEIRQIHQALEELLEKRLSADDLLRTFVVRRVNPLQYRFHKICHMSGLLDPTRVSRHDLTNAQVRRRVKAIARTEMEDNWQWGVEPYNRTRLPPLVSFHFRTDITLSSGSGF
jgi:hypothetical protein